jgi:hypothetical protein
MKYDKLILISFITGFFLQGVTLFSPANVLAQVRI